MSKLIKVSLEEAKSLKRWDGSVVPPFSEERRKGPKYYSSVLDEEGWDIITYYID